MSLTKVSYSMIQDAPVNAKDYGAIGDGTTNNYTAFVNAVAAVPTGGVLYIPAGTYFLGTSGFAISRSDISIIGEGMPNISSDNHSLTGGTILQGAVIIDGDNITVSNLGVDSGTDFVTTHLSGNGVDALVVHNIAQTSINKNIIIENVIGLAKIATSVADPTAAVHAVLLESLQYAYGSNIVGVGGWFGVVIKASDSNFSNLYGKDNDTISVQIKSNSYAPVANVNISNVRVTNAISRCYTGFAIISEQTQLNNVNASNISVDGVWTGVRIDAAESNPGYAITVSNVSVTNSQSGVDVRGPIYAANIDNVTVWQPDYYGFTTTQSVTGGQWPESFTVTNMRVAVTSSSLGAVVISNATSPARYVLDGINAAVAGGALGAKSTISIQPNTTIGQYYGTLLGNNTAATLVNGWAAAFAGQATGVIVKSGYTSGYGRISAASATSDAFLQLPAGMVPYNLNFYTTMTGYNGGTGNLENVTVLVDNTGLCSMVPNRAAYSGLSWFNLTDLIFPTEIPSEGSI